MNTQAIRDRDAAIEAMPNVSRGAKDRDRDLPRDGTKQAAPRRKPRPLAVGEARLPVSHYQARVRSKVKRQAQSATPRTEYTAMKTLLEDRDERNRLNESLQRAGLHGEALSDADRRTAHRIDSMIRRYEARNDRETRSYTPVHLPEGVVGQLDEWVQPGDTFTLHGWSIADLDAANVTSPDDDGEVLVEIRGRRGMYLGDSTGTTSTYLLPRGVTLECEGAESADIIGTNGPIAHRKIIRFQIVGE
ncbi:MAG: hypothetical protein WAX29_03975 [Propionibacterium sp.]